MKDFIYLDAETKVSKFSDRRLATVRQTLEFIQEPGEDWTSLFDKLIGGLDHEGLKKKSIAFNPDGFKVLVHSDLWICNLLFNYGKSSNRKPEKVTIVDWAVVCWNNPTVDLTNFLMTSANPEVVDNHFLELMNIYHSSLTESLEKLGVSGVDYSFERLLDDYDRGIFWASMKGLTWIPANIGTKEDFDSVNNPGMVRFFFSVSIVFQKTLK